MNFLAENNQYSASNFYSAPTGQSVYSYSAQTSQPSREPEPTKSVYLSGNRTTLSTHQTGILTFTCRYFIFIIIKLCELIKALKYFY